MLTELPGALVDLVLPRVCAGCGRPGRACCVRCAAPLHAAPVLAWPSPTPPGLPPPYVVARYDGPVRAALLAFKERGQRGLARTLGAGLAASLAAAVAGTGAAVVVRVPSSPTARRSRGFDPVEELLRVALRRLSRAGTPLRAEGALRHVRPVADSAGLGARQRWHNLSGAFAVRPRAARRLAGRSVVLVDDLVTTGATLAEAARALRAAGVGVGAAACVAATVRYR